MHRRWLALTLLGTLLWPGVATAHKINIFAYADGSTIHGEVYARDGEPIRAAEVTVLDGAGAGLGQTTTDDEGRFQFEALSRSDHKLVVDAGGGHAAEFTLMADELPDTLPSPDGQAEPRAEAPLEPGVASPEQQPPTAGDEVLRVELSAIKQQVIQLRRELNEARQARQFQDILGAVGYILGLMGLAFYFLGAKKKDAGSGTRAEP